MLRAFVAVAAFALVIQSNAHAVAITGVSGVTANGGLLLNSASVVTGAEGNNDFLGAFGTNPNRVNLNLTILEKGITDAITFTVDATTPGATEYEFAVTVNYTGINAVNGYDLQLTNFGAATVFERFPEPNLPSYFSTATGTATPFAFETPNLSPVNSTGPVRFGGLNGGGGHLINDGSTVTSFFTIDVDNGGAAIQTFTLGFTANPEPSSAALAVLALGPLVLRRRRRQA